jgi:alpha-L-fucosidase 2
MVFGGVVTERYQLNDNTLWSGFPNPGNNPNGISVLPQVREQVFAGNYDSAATLWRKCRGHIQRAIFRLPIFPEI